MSEIRKIDGREEGGDGKGVVSTYFLTGGRGRVVSTHTFSQEGGRRL